MSRDLHHWPHSILYHRVRGPRGVPRLVHGVGGGRSAFWLGVCCGCCCGFGFVLVLVLVLVLVEDESLTDWLLLTLYPHVVEKEKGGW